jgi:hypothetical protein
MVLLATPLGGDRAGEGGVEGCDAHSGSEHGIACGQR